MNKIFPLVIIFLSMSVSGCATANYLKADKTGNTLSVLQKDLAVIKKNTDAAVSSLEKIAEKAETDPRKSFNKFTTALARLDKSVAVSRSRARELEMQGDRYFKQWEEEIETVNNPEIKALAQDRKSTVLETFKQVSPLMQNFKTELEEFTSDLHDLQKYLANDLTVAGVNAAQDLIEKNRTKSTLVESSLDKLISELDSIATSITAANVSSEGTKR